MQKGKLTATAIILILFSTSIRAQNTSWNGSISTSWRAPGNWSTGTVPGSTSKVIVSGGTYDPYVPSPLGSDTAKTGVLTVQSGADLFFESNPNPGILIVYGTEKLLNDGAVRLGDGRIIFKNSITFQNGGMFDAGNGSLDFQGVNWINNSGSTFVPGTSTVTFGGTTSENLSGNISFYNVRFENTSGSVSLTGNITVTNSMVIGAGSSVTLTSGSLTLASTATLYLGTGSSLTVNGTFNNNATVTGSGTIASAKPLVNNVTSTSPTTVDVTYSEPVEASSSQNPANYSINKGIVVSAAVQEVSNHAVIHLTLSSLSTDTVYKMTVSNIVDETVTDTIGSNTQKNFQYPSNPLPVELVSFTVASVRLTSELYWSTATEVNNYGFEVERRISGSGNWVKAGFVPGAGTSSTPHEYAYKDAVLAAGRYAYRLKQIDNDGTFSYSGSAEVEIGLAAKEFKLESNYPNPFNPTTIIQFTLADDGRATLKVYNMIGQEVATLFDGEGRAGRIQRVKFDAAGLPSGLYFAKLEAGKQQMMRKMMLVK